MLQACHNFEPLRCSNFFPQIYSLYKSNFYHDLSKKDKIQRGNIVGERRQIDINDKHVSDLLNDHLARLITGDDSKFM